MDRVRDYIICNRKKYGGKPFRPYIKEYPTRQPKPLVIPHWVDPNIIDNTNSYSGKRKFKPTEIWPKCETTLLKFSISTDLSVLEHTPWQYLEEEDIPYTVQFGTEDNYYPNNYFTTEVLEGFRSTRDYIDFRDTPSYTGATPKQWDNTLFRQRKSGSILKIRFDPLVDNSPKNLYKAVDNTYIRGRASREKEIERLDRIRVQGYRRISTFAFLLQQDYIQSHIYLEEEDGDEVKPRKRRFIDLEYIEDSELVENTEDLELLEIDI